MYLVGGAVRDLLLGGRPLDLDLVVEGDAAAFAASLGGELKVHDRFGTSTVTLDGFSYDIARARRETYAHPGALPDVAPAPLAEDLERRDFTVNTLALALAGDRAGELHSVPPALEDLDARRLRVLHDQSFIDDPTRLFRLVRYATRLGFEIEPHTRALAERAIAGGALAHRQRPAGRRGAAAARPRARPRAGARSVSASSGSTPRSTRASASTTRTSPDARSRSCRRTAGGATGSRWRWPRAGCRRPSSPRSSIRWRSRPRTATRSWPPPPAPTRSRTR